MDVKNGGIRSCTQYLIGGGEVRVMLINLGQRRCLMPIGMEHCGQCNNGRTTKAVNNKICAPSFILHVEMELL
jgi:hypothetical protein